MSPTIPFREISSAAVLEVGERLTEAPSKRLTDIALGALVGGEFVGN